MYKEVYPRKLRAQDKIIPGQKARVLPGTIAAYTYTYPTTDNFKLLISLQRVSLDWEINMQAPNTHGGGGKSTPDPEANYQATVPPSHL